MNLPMLELPHTMRRYDAPRDAPTSDIRRRRIAEIMSWSVHTISTEQTCGEARRLAAAWGVDHLPVQDRGTLAGIVCACDLRGAADAAPVTRRMRAPVVTIRVQTECRQAIAVMRAWDVGALPVMYRGFLIGIVTTGDLVRAGAIDAARRPGCAAHRRAQDTEVQP